MKKRDEWNEDQFINDLRANTHRLISLLCCEFLWKEVIKPQGRFKNWFGEISNSGYINQKIWTELISDLITEAAEEDFSQILGRNLREGEKQFLKGNIKDFVEAYDLCLEKAVKVQFKKGVA